MATLALNRAAAPNELNNDTISKFYLYVNTLKQGIRAEAFERTQQQMATHRAQNPQIDVNGNAAANELLDLRGLGQRRIPADISSLSLPTDGLRQSVN